MSNNHNAIRYGDEYQCSTCGKAWAIDDKDVPECCENGPTFDKCDVEVSMLKARIAILRGIIIDGDDLERVEWSPKQCYNHLNILKLRDTISKHQ